MKKYLVIIVLLSLAVIGYNVHFYKARINVIDASGIEILEQSHFAQPCIIPLKVGGLYEVRRDKYKVIYETLGFDNIGIKAISNSGKLLTVTSTSEIFRRNITKQSMIKKAYPYYLYYVISNKTINFEIFDNDIEIGRETANISQVVCNAIEKSIHSDPRWGLW